jgi:hypothetical protein
LNLIRVMPAKGQDMQRSYYIARLIGPVLCTVGIAMLVNPETYRQIAHQFLLTPAFLYVTGVLLLTAGLAILNAHPLWTPDWRSLVTLIGWMATAAGVWRILAPQYIPFVGGAIIAHEHFFIGVGVVLLAAGGFLSFKGYVSSAGAVELETQHE